MVRKDRRRNSSLNSGDLPTREASDMVTCIFTLAKFFQKKKQKHERMMAHCTMHISSHISVYCINQTHFLLPTLSVLNSLLTRVASGASKSVLFYLVKPKFPNSDMSVLWGKNVPWNTYACLRQGEVRSTSFPLCTGQRVCRSGHPQRRRGGSRTGKTFWKQVWEAKGL